MFVESEVSVIAQGNKIMELTGEVQQMSESLKKVLAVMTDEIPDNDLPADDLENVVWTSKQKLSAFKSRLANFPVVNLRDASEKTKTVYEAANRDVGIALAECEWVLKRIIATSLKWEVGASEVIKALRKRATEMERKYNMLQKRIDDIVAGFGEYVDVTTKSFEEVEERFNEVEHKTDILSGTMLTVNAFNEFKLDLSKIIRDQVSSQPTTKLVAFN